jgi:hypothetical protein
MYRILFKTNYALLLLILTMSACQPALTPSPLPSPVVISVQRTPALQPLKDVFDQCTAEFANTALVMLETPAGMIDLDHASLSLRWGAGSEPAGYAAVLGEEQLVLVANPANPVESITLADLRAIYNGSLRNWPGTALPNGEVIQAWAYPSSEDTQQIFELNLTNGETPRASAVHIAPGPAEMLEAVAESPAAMGYLPRRWLDERVKEITIKGIEAENLRQPILSLSNAEPAGIEKAWLVCLQEQIR